MNPDYGLTITLSGVSFDDAVARTTEALGEEGFGILTEIDVKATMKKKLDVEMDDYLILGACNPPLAHQAIEAELPIGLLLPCNVIVVKEGDDISVSAVRPSKMFEVVSQPGMEEIAAEVEERLERVMETI